MRMGIERALDGSISPSKEMGLGTREKLSASSARHIPIYSISTDHIPKINKSPKYVLAINFGSSYNQFV